MNRFYFCQDKKVTAWHRSKFSVQAQTEEVARKKVAQIIAKYGDVVEAYETHLDTQDDPAAGIELIDNYWLYETMEPVTLEEEGGRSTVQVLAKNGDLVYDNTTKVYTKRP